MMQPAPVYQPTLYEALEALPEIGRRIEATADNRSIPPEPGMDGEQELAHDGTEGVDLFQPPRFDEVAVKGPDVGIVARGAERGHIQSNP